MDDMRAIKQDELRQDLAGLIIPSTAVPTPATIILPAATNPPVEDALLTNNDNARGNL